MSKKNFKPDAFTPHYDDGSLLSYRDGELPPETAQAVQRHLAECWGCSTRLCKLEQAIACLLAAEPRLEEYEVPPMGATRRELRAQMAELRAGFPIGSSSLGSRPLSIWRNRWAMAVALGFVFLMGVALLFHSSRTWEEPKVSAAELIYRIHEAERARLFTPNKIIHQVSSYEQKKGAPSTPLPDGVYWIERWWDNTSVPRRMVYRMRDATGQLVSGTWIFADGASVRYEQYTKSDQPQVLHGPSFETIRRYIQRLPARHRADVERLLSLAEQHLEVYEQTSLARWQQFLEEIRISQVKGQIQQSQINGQPVYILTVDRVDDTWGPYRWVGIISLPDFRVLESTIFASPSHGVYELKWTEIEFEAIPPEQVVPSVFNPDPLPKNVISRHLTVAESIQQLEDNAKSLLPQKK